MTPAEEIKNLHTTYGLSYAQLGRVFGVSDRLVQLWASGHVMNKGHEELLIKILAALDASPDASVYDKIRIIRQPGERIGGSPYSWDNLLG